MCVYGGYYSTPPHGFARWGLYPRSSPTTVYFCEPSDLIHSQLFDMKHVSALIIAVLGIALITVSARNAELRHELNVANAKTERLINATEEVFNEVETYIDEKYGEFLSDTIWEGDVYDNWYSAYEDIVCF